MADFIRVDSLGFLSIDGLYPAVGEAARDEDSPQFCDACFTAQYPTRLADRIFEAGSQLLARKADGTRFRLIGIGVSEFGDPRPADPADLIDRTASRRAAAEAAIDDIRGRFGNRAVETGLVFDAGGHARKTGREDL